MQQDEDANKTYPTFIGISYASDISSIRQGHFETLQYDKGDLFLNSSTKCCWGDTLFVRNIFDNQVIDITVKYISVIVS